MEILLHFENMAAPGLSFSIPIKSEKLKDLGILKRRAIINQGESEVIYPYSVDFLNGYFTLEFIEAAAEPVTVPA